MIPGLFQRAEHARNTTKVRQSEDAQVVFYPLRMEKIHGKSARSFPHIKKITTFASSEYKGVPRLRAGNGGGGRAEIIL